jgi:GNAT superfamily N-acetyltransferase
MLPLPSKFLVACLWAIAAVVIAWLAFSSVALPRADLSGACASPLLSISGGSKESGSARLFAPALSVRLVCANGAAAGDAFASGGAASPIESACVAAARGVERGARTARATTAGETTPPPLPPSSSFVSSTTTSSAPIAAFAADAGGDWEAAALVHLPALAPSPGGASSPALLLLPPTSPACDQPPSDDDGASSAVRVSPHGFLYACPASSASSLEGIGAAAFHAVSLLFTAGSEGYDSSSPSPHGAPPTPPLPTPHPTSSAAVRTYMQSVEFREWMRLRRGEQGTWGLAGVPPSGGGAAGGGTPVLSPSLLPLDLVLLHATGSGLEADLTDVPQAVVREADDLARALRPFLHVEVSCRAALHGRVADEGLLTPVDVGGGSSGDGDGDGDASSEGRQQQQLPCFAFVWDEWALMAVETYAHASVAVGGRALPSSAVLLYGQTRGRNGAQGAHSTLPDVFVYRGRGDGSGSVSAAHPNATCRRARCRPTPHLGSSPDAGLGRPRDGDLGRSYPLEIAARVAAWWGSRRSGSPQPSFACAPESRFLCTCDDYAGEATPSVPFCAAGPQHAPFHGVLYVPPEPLRPIYVRSFFGDAREAGEVGAGPGSSPFAAACRNGTGPWPERAASPGNGKALSSTVDIRRWGSIYVANNAKAAAAGQASSWQAAAAAEAVGMLRRHLGLPSRPVVGVRVDYIRHEGVEGVEGAQPSMLASSAVSAADGEVSAESAATAAAAAGPPPVAPLVRLLLRPHPTTTSSSPSAALPAALPFHERLDLARRWWAAHEEVALSSLRGTCAIARRTPRLLVPAHTLEAVEASLALLASAREALAAAHDDPFASLPLIRLARLHAESLVSDPYLVPDPFAPLSHILAVHLPAWAPMILPLLIALFQGVRRLLRKGGRKGRGAAGPPDLVFLPDGQSSRFTPSRVLPASPILIRPFRPSDGAAVRALYAAGQAAHVLSPNAIRVHLGWLRFVLTGDLARVGEVYQGQGQGAGAETGEKGGPPDAPGLPSQFWVATVSREAYARLESFALAPSPSAAKRDPLTSPSSVASAAASSSSSSSSVSAASSESSTSGVGAFDAPHRVADGIAASDAIATEEETLTDAEYERRMAELLVAATASSHPSPHTDPSPQPFRPPSVSEIQRAAGLRTGGGGSPGLPPLLDADGDVIVGTVAVVPFEPEDVHKAAEAREEGVGGGGQGAAPLAPPPGSDPRITPGGAPHQQLGLPLSAVAELKRMNVAPGVRRCGLARALVAHAEAWASGRMAAAASGAAAAAGVATARPPSYRGMFLSTLRTMRGAVELYPACGFSALSPPGPDGRAEEFKGVPIHVVEFGKRLGPATP